MPHPKSSPKAVSSKADAGSPEEPAPNPDDGAIFRIDPRTKRSSRRKSLSAKDISALTEGVISALTAAGGVNYLLAIARDDPKTFCALLAKVLPVRIDAKPETGFTLAWQQDPEAPAAPDTPPRR